MSDLRTQKKGPALTGPFLTDVIGLGGAIDLAPLGCTHPGHLPSPTDGSGVSGLPTPAVHDQLRHWAKWLSERYAMTGPNGGCPLHRLSHCHHVVPSMNPWSLLHRPRPSCADQRRLYGQTEQMARRPFVRTAGVIRRNHRGNRPKGPNRPMPTGGRSVVHRHGARSRG